MSEVSSMPSKDSGYLGMFLLSLHCRVLLTEHAHGNDSGSWDLFLPECMMEIGTPLLGLSYLCLLMHKLGLHSRHVLVALRHLCIVVTGPLPLLALLF